MTKHLYYRNGVEISEADALDHRGLLRDQTTLRVRTTMRDSPTLWAGAPSDSRPLFTDGSNDPTQGNRPGWRKRVGDKRQAVMDAYRKYDLRLTNAYWLHDGEISCPDCEGSGTAPDGGLCDTCGGDGIVDADSYETSPGEAFSNSEVSHDSRRSIDAAGISKHRQLMDRLYRDYDQNLQQMWRQR